MQKLHLLLIFISVCTVLKAQNSNLAKPNNTQLKYSEAEIGVIIHLDLEIYKPEVFWRDYMGKDSISKALPLSLFNPSKLNTDSWIKTAKAMGAKYAVLVAKHTSGFALWPTKAYPYNISNTPWKGGKGDIVADFIRSCKKYGILPGIYCSYAANAWWNVDNGKVLKEIKRHKRHITRHTKPWLASCGARKNTATANCLPFGLTEAYPNQRPEVRISKNW